MSAAHARFSDDLRDQGGKEGRFKLFYNDIYHVQLPDKHRFPMGKYRMVRETIEKHPQAAANIDLEPSPLVAGNDLRTTHCPEYIKRFLCNMLTERENRNIGFPWSPAGVKRALSSVGGTVAAAHAVCSGEYLFSGHVAGGTHHAFYDYGEGFCVFSDIAVAANVALRDYPEVLHLPTCLSVSILAHQPT
jgi:acetoin utilization deacetylase AcuC-like enzyme